jgi:hypothetical protein
VSLWLEEAQLPFSSIDSPPQQYHTAAQVNIGEPFGQGIGLAIRPFGDATTVVRAGYGVEPRLFRSSNHKDTKTRRNAKN